MLVERSSYWIWEPVKIADLARKMIHLMGLAEKTKDEPSGDIEVSQWPAAR